MIRSLWAPAVGLLFTLALVGFFLVVRPLDRLTEGVPPREALVVEASRLRPDGIELVLRADGAAPVRIAQVQVDGAYWRFVQEPPGVLARLGTVRLFLPYPWQQGATHHLRLVSATGATFDHTIEVAIATPPLTAATLGLYGLVGLAIGVVPVAIGLLGWPLLRRLSQDGLGFVLSLTLGLLAFLFLDTFAEALAAAARLPAALRGEAVVWLATLLVALALFASGRRGGTVPEAASLAFFVALGIGLHNLGEGLAVGAALATGEAALASFLVAGFTLHNVSEGLGIAAPLVRERPSFAFFSGLALLAGLPAIVGSWAGAFVATPLPATLCFVAAAGAILQVMVELAAWLVRSETSTSGAGLRLAHLAGFALGLAVMYATGLWTAV